MQHTLFNFLGPALIPELSADIAAGSAGDIHLVLIGIAALRTFPDELAVFLHNRNLAIIAADLAVVRFGIELCVDDVVIDEFHDLKHGIQIVLHVRNLDIGDGPAGGETLELSFKLKLLEGINLLGDVHMIAVCDVALVRDARDDAETTLETLGELVGGGLERGAVETEINIVHGLPLAAGSIQVFHDLKCKRGGIRIGVALAGHVTDTFVKAGIAEGQRGISAVQELVNGLALFKTCTGTILPEDRGGIRERSLETVVAAHECTVAKVEALIKDLPELVTVSTGGKSQIHKVQCDNALIKATIVLGLIVLIDIGGQEAAAAHAGIAVALAVFVDLELQHLLLGDVIGHHAAGGALGSQLGQIPVLAVLVDIVLLTDVDELRESRGDPDTLLILDALPALLQCLLDDECEIFPLLIVLGLTQIHEHGDKGRLTVGGQQGNNLILDGLDAAADFLTKTLFRERGDGFLRRLKTDGIQLFNDRLANLFAGDLDKRGQVSQRNGLSAILVRRNLGNDLRGNVAGRGEGMRTFDQRSGNDGSILQHVLEIDKITVMHMLCIVIAVMEVDDALVVRFDDILRQEDALREITAHLACNVVALCRIHDGILVCILLFGFLIIAFDKGENAVICGIVLAIQRTGLEIGNVMIGQFKSTMCHDLVFHHVLDFFDTGRAVKLLT